MMMKMNHVATEPSTAANKNQVHEEVSNNDFKLTVTTTQV